ncbi:MAG: hypothetical protein U9O24_03700 [Campylobacterota bacterium]|nr:hypothetical protein [Campylobacterota bacterium]
MKNILEHIAITLLLVLFIFIIVMIVEYKIIDDQSNESKVSMELIDEEQEELPKDKRSHYLENLETYTEVDVKVDPKKIQHVNRVEITSELAKDDMESAISNVNKPNYEKSLNNYNSKSNAKVETKSKAELKREKEEDESVKLEKDEIIDDIGIAIDAALEDI